jgi:phosphatidylinositol kinase/protein kinase (PI-3  family)
MPFDVSTMLRAGETLHVDFGCLFDRALTLEVPERVPFRLTQNVIDCFGVSGVEGTFRRAAEMTLQVRRSVSLPTTLSERRAVESCSKPCSSL